MKKLVGYYANAHYPSYRHGQMVAQQAKLGNYLS